MFSKYVLKSIWIEPLPGFEPRELFSPKPTAIYYVTGYLPCDIRFSCPFGDQLANVELNMPNGTGSDTYHLYVNRYFRGRISFIRNEWVNLDHKILTEDFYILVDIIESFRRLPSGGWPEEKE